MLQGWWPPPRGLRVISHLDTGWRTELSKPWEAAERFLSDSASRDRPGGDFGMSRLWCQPGPSLCPPLMEWEAGRGRSRMDTGPKAKGKASNPAKLQLQVRAKLRAGLISPSLAGARRIPGGRRTCPELSLSTRRFLGCLEGLRKSSSAMAGHSRGLGAHRTRPQSAWLCQHNQHELVWKQKYKFLFTKYRIKQYIQGMAAFKTIHNHMDFRSLPLVVIPPFFSSLKRGNFCL